MRDALRLKRLGFGQAWLAGLGWIAAALISACAAGPDADRVEATGQAAGGDAERKLSDVTSNQLSYFLASPVAGGERSADGVSSTFRTLSGATVDLWREAEPTRTIAFDEIRALRIREGRPSPSLAPASDYVVADIQVGGSEAKFFMSLLKEQGDAFFWIWPREGEAIDFLPVAYALRPSKQGAQDRVWVSAGTFQNREAAEKFFGGLGDIPREFIPLSETERATALAENARLVDYAIWESVCDPSALATLEGTGGHLRELLAELPNYAERARGVDCGVRPELGARMDGGRSAAGGAAGE